MTTGTSGSSGCWRVCTSNSRRSGSGLPSLIPSFNAHLDRTPVDGLMSLRVDGIVIATEPSEEMFAALDVPAVVAGNRDIPVPGADVVANDDLVSAAGSPPSTWVGLGHRDRPRHRRRRRRPFTARRGTKPPCVRTDCWPLYQGGPRTHNGVRWLPGIAEAAGSEPIAHSNFCGQRHHGAGCSRRRPRQGSAYTRGPVPHRLRQFAFGARPTCCGSPRSTAATRRSGPGLQRHCWTG